MSSFKYKFQMYKHLQQNTQNIYAEAKQVAEELGISFEEAAQQLQDLQDNAD